MAILNSSDDDSYSSSSSSGSGSGGGRFNPLDTWSDSPQGGDPTPELTRNALESDRVSTTSGSTSGSSSSGSRFNPLDTWSDSPEGGDPTPENTADIILNDDNVTAIESSTDDDGVINLDPYQDIEADTLQQALNNIRTPSFPEVSDGSDTVLKAVVLGAVGLSIGAMLGGLN